LARLEGRIVLDEVLERFPDWEVDMVNAKMGGHVRGWDSLPVFVR
jgi:cytochrome P450